MNTLSKSMITGALAILVTSAAFTASMTTAAEAGGRAHFRHAIRFCHNQSNHPYRCFNRVYNRVYNRALGNGYGLGYVSGYNIVNYCGWNVTTFKKWNPAHTRLIIVKNRVWTCN